MRYRVLGSLSVWTGTAWSTIRAGQQRAVLAVLLVEAGRVVSTDRLVDELWGQRPPRAAVSTVQGYVMRLRRLIAAAPTRRLVTRGHGYELLVEDGELDAALFERLAASGRRSLAEGQLDTGVARLTEALALWRGPALADVPATPTVTAETARLEQRRLTVLEQVLGAELDRGRHADVVDDLCRLVQQHPLHEQLWAHLMVALHRCGRRAEALDAYRRGRAALVTELGVEPGARLRELHGAILAE
jgi:DNA-binding SARP family transcriptional activator